MDLKERLWPLSKRAALIAIPVIWLVAAVLLFASRAYLGWPDVGCTKLVVPITALLGFLPLGLVLIDFARSRNAENPKLVNLEQFKLLMSGVELDDSKLNEYINARWLKYVEWWDSRAAKAKWKYLALRSTVVVGSALIPALVGLRELKRFEEADWMFSVASIFVSLAVAICAGLESLFGWGDIWREKRMAAEIIKSEGFSFLQLTGGYAQFKTHQEAYKLFAQNVEELIRHEIKDYIVAVSPKPETTPDSKPG